MSPRMSRRSFLAGSGGLVIAFAVERSGEAFGAGKAAGTAAASTSVNGFVRIGEDDSITVIVPEAEMGQGILTAFAMLVADELGAELAVVRTEFAPADEAKYGRQITGGSRSVRSRHRSLREAGAAAREMLISAAAAQWKVEPASCRTAGGQVLGPSGQSARFGALARRASALKVPAQPALKPDDQLTLVGKPARRLDTPAKVRGEAAYGMDVKVPGLLTALVERSPSFGGKVKRFDAAKARAVPGVRRVEQIPSGIAVIADHFWAAKAGREALQVEWEEPNASLSSDGVRAELAKLSGNGKVAATRGDPDKALAAASAARRVEAVYEVPYLAHAPMEPVNATAEVKGGRCTVWAPTQTPGMVRDSAAKICGLAPGQVDVRVTYLGGGFGRKSTTDYTDEAVHCAKLAGKPVKVVYTREDDMAAAFYRPASYSHLVGSVDEQGWPVAWTNQIASPSIMSFFMPGWSGDIDGSSVQGADIPYAVPHFRLTCAAAPIPVPVWWWRSVGHSINAYVTECFFDELARLGKKDPLEARLKLLSEHPRHARVLQAAAEKIGWGKPAPSGVGRGIALADCFGSIIAEAAEVTLEGSEPRILRMTCALDCGKVVNPSTIMAQMESGIVYGLSAALHGQIRIEGGRPVQRTFYDYPVLRMSDMPRIETVLVHSGDAIGGVGELGTPPAAPAVVNALLALTGKPIRKLPIQTQA
ncbi:MAG TPA: xanthine dehydrogenase family protein molybdopterin-binding subunit [Myxococcales bacterium]|nr:xanthine dehydrogenase family protein molybdopterin-binding subunit [Myxococcales bacterium]